MSAQSVGCVYVGQVMIQKLGHLKENEIEIMQDRTVKMTEVFR